MRSGYSVLPDRQVLEVETLVSIVQLGLREECRVRATNKIFTRSTVRFRDSHSRRILVTLKIVQQTPTTLDGQWSENCACHLARFSRPVLRGQGSGVEICDQRGTGTLIFPQTGYVAPAQSEAAFDWSGIVHEHGRGREKASRQGVRVHVGNVRCLLCMSVLGPGLDPGRLSG